MSFPDAESLHIISHALQVSFTFFGKIGFWPHASLLSFPNTDLLLLSLHLNFIIREHKGIGDLLAVWIACPDCVLC